MVASILAAIAAIGVVLIAALLFRRLGDVDDHGPDGATATHTGAMLSALFLLAFAIAIVVPWTSADSARENTYTESQAIVEAYWAAARLPVPLRDQTQAELRDYARFVRDREWPLMARGRLSPDGWSRLDTMRRQVAGLHTNTDAAREIQTSVLDQLADVSGARRQRAMDASNHPPAGLLAITVITGVLVALFPLLAGARPRGLTMLPFLAMAGLLGVGVYLCFNIAHVFTGALSVRPGAFTSALDDIQRISGGG